MSNDKDTQFVCSDKCCNTADGKESNLMEKVTKPSSESEDNEKVVERIKDIKIKKTVDKDGNITVEKRTITKTYRTQKPLGNCLSESDIYKKPNYGESDRTITTAKPKLTGKFNKSCLKPCGTASTEVLKTLSSGAVSFDTFKCDPIIKNRSAISKSQSASVASLDYSCIDEPISACDMCSEPYVLKESKATQTCPNYPKLDNEKPESRYCTIKIFTKADSDVPIDEVHSVELTPSTLDLLSKILPQGNKPSRNIDILKSQTSPKCDCSTKTSGILKKKSMCSIDKHQIFETPVKPKTPKIITSLGDVSVTQVVPSPILPKVVKIAGTELKSVSTETFTGLKRPSRSEVPKHSCVSKVIEPTHSLMKKKNSVAEYSCKFKKSVDDTESKYPCSKSQNEPGQNSEQNIRACSKEQRQADKSKCNKNLELKTCTCSKEQSQEAKYKCNKKQETTKPKCCEQSEAPNTDSKSIDSKDSKFFCKAYKTNEKSPSENTDSAKTSKSNSNTKCCIKSEASNTDSKSIDSKDSKKFCTGYKKNEKSPPENTDTVETRKPNIHPKCCPKSETPETVGRSIDSNDIICPFASEPETKDAVTQKSFDSMSKYYCFPKVEKTVPPEYPVCGKKDASTSTRRSDRYDVRPLRLLMRLSRAPYSSVSDSVLINNKSSIDTIVRKCTSYCCQCPKQI